MVKCEMYLCCPIEITNRLKLIASMATLIEITELIRLLLVTEWFLPVTWSTVIILEMVFIILLLFADLLLLLGAKSRSTERLVPWLFGHAITFVICCVLFVKFLINIFVITNSSTQNDFMDLPPGMGYASPEFQQTFRYKLGFLFGKIIAMGFLCPLNAYCWVVVYLDRKTLLQESDEERDEKLKRKKEKELKDIYKVSGSRDFLNEPSYKLPGRYSDSRRSFHRQNSLPRHLSDFQRSFTFTDINQARPSTASSSVAQLQNSGRTTRPSTAASSIGHLQRSNTLDSFATYKTNSTVLAYGTAQDSKVLSYGTVPESVRERTVTQSLPATERAQTSVRGPATAQTLPETSRPEQRGPQDQVQYSTIVQQQEQQQLQMAQQFSRQASLPRNTLLQRKASGIDLNEVVPSRKTGTSGSLRYGSNFGSGESSDLPDNRFVNMRDSVTGQRVLGDSRDVQPLPQTLASFPEEGNQENIKKLRNTRDSVAHQRVLTRQPNVRGYNREMSEDTTYNVPSIATEFSYVGQFNQGYN